MAKFKKRQVKMVFFLLAVIIIPSFILWGFEGVFRKEPGPRFAGKIWGRKISFSEYESALLACRIRAMMLFGDEFFKIQEFLNLEEQAWEWLILKEDLKRRKIKVDDREVIKEISDEPLFQKEGRFNKELYLRILNYFRISPRDFEEQIRSQLGFRKLFSDITRDITLTPEEILQAYKREHQDDFSEEKFLKEKDDFSKRLIEVKKLETFNRYLKKLKEEANLQDNIRKMRSLER